VARQYNFLTADFINLDPRAAGIILLMAKDKKNILTSPALNEVQWVHEKISESKVAVPTTQPGNRPEYFTYNDACAKWQGRCFVSQCLQLGVRDVGERASGGNPVRYPVAFDQSGEPMWLPSCLAEPELTNVTGDVGVVVSSPAIRLPYFLDERDGIRQLM
jgi:hypothetical protein